MEEAFLDVSKAHQASILGGRKENASVSHWQPGRVIKIQCQHRSQPSWLKGVTFGLLDVSGTHREMSYHVKLYTQVPFKGPTKLRFAHRI